MTMPKKISDLQIRRIFITECSLNLLVKILNFSDLLTYAVPVIQAV